MKRETDILFMTRAAALLLAVMILTALGVQTARAQVENSVQVNCYYWDHYGGNAGDYYLGPNGGTASADVLAASEGQTVTLTATPATGYRFKRWRVRQGGVTLADAYSTTTTFTMSINPVVLEAYFDIGYDVSTTANPVYGGSVQVSTDNSNWWYNRLFHVPPGTTVYYRGTANSGYMFSNVGIAPYEGAVTMVPSGSFTMPANDVMVTIDFGTDPFAVAPMYPTILTESKDFDASYAAALNGQTATFSRNFTEGVASTLCLPFNFAPELQDVGTFYSFAGVNAEKTEVTMNEIDAGGVLPCRPILFIPSVNGTVTFSGEIRSTDYAPGSHEPLYGWTFQGTFSTIEWTSDPLNIYGFASGQAYGGASDATEAGTFIRVHTGGIRPFRAYLQYTGGSGARALTRGETDALPETMTVRLVSRIGETTAIGTLDTRTGEMTFGDGTWYSLDGQRLTGTPSAKGIYIRNGKKTVIK